MSDGENKTLREDGLFKLLTWNSLAITRLFGLPEIAGEPIQQEYQFPTERRVDRLYCLADGSLLNIEHQSRLGDHEALAGARQFSICQATFGIAPPGDTKN